MKHRIRYFAPEHAPIALITKFEKEFFPQRKLDVVNANAHWYVAYSGGAPWNDPIGFSGVKIDGENSLLIAAAVKPEHRGCGLHKVFIRKRVVLSVAYGVKDMWTYTMATNWPSINNLISNKFKACPFPDVLLGTDLDVSHLEDVTIWRKRLYD